MLLPFLPIGSWFGFVPLPGLYWLALAAILVAYMALTQFVKSRMIRRFGLL
jgi:Mg2+-importing ATPase